MRWPPFTHVFFDCDSTLTSIEGIDILAESAGKGWRVSVLTDAAMRGDVGLQEIYARRLQAVRPTRGQIQAIRHAYKQNIVTDARAVIDLLKSLGHQVYIISGGLEEAIVEFGLFMGVPRNHIRAVSVDYDSLSGKWWQQLGESPNHEERYLGHAADALTVSDGKARIIGELVGDRPGRRLLIGDGMSDLLAGHAVDLFVGYGGVTARTRVQKEAAVFLNSRSLAPILALAAGPAVLKRPVSTEAEKKLFERAARLILAGAITFQSETLNDKFKQAWKATY